MLKPVTLNQPRCSIHCIHFPFLTNNFKKHSFLRCIPTQIWWWTTLLSLRCFGHSVRLVLLISKHIPKGKKRAFHGARRPMAGRPHWILCLLLGPQLFISPLGNQKRSESPPVPNPLNVNLLWEQFSQLPLNRTMSMMDPPSLKGSTPMYKRMKP